MKKSELVQIISSKSGVSKSQVNEVLAAFTDAVTDLLKAGDQINLPGLCTISVTQRAERMGRNPQTGETIKIKAAKLPKFKPVKNLKDAVQQA